MKDSTAWFVTEAARSQVGALYEHVFARIAAGQSRHLVCPASDAQRSRIALAAHRTETVGSPQNLAIAGSPASAATASRGAARPQGCDTAKMGRDAMSVVDAHLNVYGLQGLRVANGSIMPRVTTGNTMAPCVVIGERAADMIRKEHGL